MRNVTKKISAYNAKATMRQQTEPAELTAARKHWHMVAYGTKGFSANAGLYGEKKANEIADEAQAELITVASKYNLDTHGNPL